LGGRINLNINDLTWSDTKKKKTLETPSLGGTGKK